MDSYSSAVEINPGGHEYTRRSEWLFHPDPVANYERCLNALLELGYEPAEHIFSSCGCRMDYGTFRKLRHSRFGVLAKFPTLDEECRVDYPAIPEMPWYVADLDAFVFPWAYGMQSNLQDFERGLETGRPIFLLNHGYEFCDPWFENNRSYRGLREFGAAHRDELVSVRYGDYARLLHARASGAGTH